MTEDLLSLRALVVSREESLHDLFRRAASSLAVPVEIVAAADATSARSALAGHADLAYLDGALPPDHRTQVTAALRGAAKPPFSILLAAGAAAAGYATDGVAGRPSRVEESLWLLDRSMRVRLPSRVLVVDDSPTIRSIVRKALLATRFPFEVTEAEAGIAALKLVREGRFDIVFLDYNLPGLSGLATLSGLNREKRPVSVVMISSTQDATVAKQARELGAAFLKKPFFPADIEKVLCGYYGLRALHPHRT